MPTKHKPNQPSSSKAPYPSLRKARVAAHRVAQAMEREGYVPLTDALFDREEAEPSTWPEREFADFENWLPVSRAQGQYAP